jgi:hypothetical protein
MISLYKVKELAVPQKDTRGRAGGVAQVIEHCLTSLASVRPQLQAPVLPKKKKNKNYKLLGNCKPL